MIKGNDFPFYRKSISMMGEPLFLLAIYVDNKPHNIKDKEWLIKGNIYTIIGVGFILKKDDYPDVFVHLREIEHSFLGGYNINRFLPFYFSMN